MSFKDSFSTSEPQLSGELIDYGRNRSKSILLPYACNASCSKRDLVIFDVRDKISPSASNLFSFDLFVTPKETKEEISADLRQADGTVKLRLLPKNLRRLPSELLYDGVGLDLFEKVTQLEDEYYLTSCERDVLKTKGFEIFDQIPNGASVIELGCGTMSKTAIILNQLRQAGKKGIKFYALDIEEASLRASIMSLMREEVRENVSEEFKIQYGGILGTYEQACATFIRDIKGTKVFLWLGSSIGNYDRPEAAEFLKSFQKQAMGTQDLFFIGIDKKNDPNIVARAYNDSQGLTLDFSTNGLNHLSKILGRDNIKIQNFNVLAGYNQKEGRNEVYYHSLCSQTVLVPSVKSESKQKVHLEKDELVRIEVSVKYSLADIQELAASSGLTLYDYWMDSKNMFHFCLFKKPPESSTAT